MTKGFQAIWVLLAGMGALLGVFGNGFTLGATTVAERSTVPTVTPPINLQVAVAMTKYARQSPQHRSTCLSSEGPSESDRCAQWRSANAAESSAFWAKLGFFVSTAGVIGLFLTLLYTREAVKDTAKATDAMLQQNDMMQRSNSPVIDLRVSARCGEKIVYVDDSSISQQKTLTVTIIPTNHAIGNPVQRAVFTSCECSVDGLFANRIMHGNELNAVEAQSTTGLKDAEYFLKDVIPSQFIGREVTILARYRYSNIFGGTYLLTERHSGHFYKDEVTQQNLGVSCVARADMHRRDTNVSPVTVER